MGSRTYLPGLLSDAQRIGWTRFGRGEGEESAAAGAANQLGKQCQVG